MILGIGTDIVEVARIRAVIAKHDKLFMERIFTLTEQQEAERRDDSGLFYASRWAAKEAFSKALGCGISEACGWQDICVANNKEGKPFITLNGNARETAETQGVSNIHLSLSHEKHYTCATVVLEGKI